MKHIFVSLLIVSLALASPALGVGGISGGKVVVPEAGTIGKGQFEFETAFSQFSSTRVYDNGSKSLPRQGKLASSEVGFRFTAGITEKLEIGGIVPVALEEEDIDGEDPMDGEGIGDVSVGTKYRLWQSSLEKNKLALQAGVTFATGDDRPEPAELPTGNGYATRELGVIYSREFVEGLTVDVDVVAVDHFARADGDPEYGYAADMGWGYFVTEAFQPVIEVNYSYESSPGFRTRRASRRDLTTFPTNALK
jgi:hypothetical protein